LFGLRWKPENRIRGLLDQRRDRSVRFEKLKDGRYRSSQLLPDEECVITVTVPGYRPQSRTISLVEGTTSELAIKLEPR